MPRTDLLPPADLACFLATDGRRRTGATYAGQAKGARRKADCIGDGEMLLFPQDTHKNNQKTTKKKKNTKECCDGTYSSVKTAEKIRWRANSDAGQESCE